MTYASIIQNIKAGKTAPIYFLYGDEPFYIDAITKAVETSVLPEDQQSFNQTVLYGGDTDMLTVVSEAKRYPMMAEKVVVIVKEAQEIKNWEALEGYLDQPQPSTVLLFGYKYKKPDKRKKVFKMLSNAPVYFESSKVRDWHLVDWIKTHVRTKDYSLTDKAAHLMAESLGTDLGRIDSEMEKLRLVVSKGGLVDEHIIEDNIGISKDFNNFELQKALALKNAEKVLQIQRYFAANPKDNPMVVTMGILFGFFSKMLLLAQSKVTSEREAASLLRVPPMVAREYVAALHHYGGVKNFARIIGYLREYDARSKGKGNGNTATPELMRELLLKIMYR